MLPSWWLVVLMHDRKCLDTIDVASLPMAVCGMLGRMLANNSRRVALRSDVARHLRRTLTPEWTMTADLIEVCAVLDGLQACDPDGVGGEDIAAVAKRLVESEIEVGGPYVSDGRLDPVANAAVAQCVDWLAAPLPKLTSFLQANVPGIETVMPENRLLWSILQTMDGRSPQLGQMLTHLELCTAAIAEAVVLESEEYMAAGSSTAATQEMAARIRTRCLHLDGQLAEPLQASTHAMLEQVIKADTNQEISQLAWYYGTALQTPPADIGREVYVRLGVANLFAWSAYTIYDDFLDGEGQSALLGTANYSLRAMLRQYYAALPGVREFAEFVERVLVMVDQANAYETSYMRFAVSRQTIVIDRLPEFRSCDLLADRALFHVLGPMGVMAAAGVEIDDPRWRHTLQAFRHYLIARQLNDDIHDWVKDLQAGQATYVVVELLRFLNVGPGMHMLERLLPHARQQFWQAVLPQICETALNHMALARRELAQGLPMTERNRIASLFDYTENAMLAANLERQKSWAVQRAFAVP